MQLLLLGGHTAHSVSGAQRWAFPNFIWGYQGTTLEESRSGEGTMSLTIPG